MNFRTEKAFTRWLLREARARGWLAVHPSNMTVVRRRDGTTRAIPDRDATGFPDVVLVHERYGLLFAELKMPKGKPKPEQYRWLRALRLAGQRVYVWWPEDEAEILAVLDGARTRLFEQEGAA